MNITPQDLLPVWRVVENIAYVADQSAGLQVIDISNPFNPQRMGGLAVSGAYYNDVVVQNEYAYVACKPGGMHIIDISNPASPSRVAIYGISAVKGVAVQGLYAYVYATEASLSSLHVIDISNPAKPINVGVYRYSVAEMEQASKLSRITHILQMEPMDCW